MPPALRLILIKSDFGMSTKQQTLPLTQETKRERMEILWLLALEWHISKYVQ